MLAGQAGFASALRFAGGPGHGLPRVCLPAGGFLAEEISSRSGKMGSRSTTKAGTWAALGGSGHPWALAN